MLCYIDPSATTSAAFLFIIALVVGVIVLAVSAALYMLPAIVAFIRKKENKIAIAVLNLLLGWSMIAWVIALVLALTKDKKPEVIVINNVQPAEASAEDK
ncbi:MAG: superinfection immunity protein [Ruminococcus sp.]|nr:superinfection immunity protein [Ruminococcus sp.]